MKKISLKACQVSFEAEVVMLVFGGFIKFSIVEKLSQVGGLWWWTSFLSFISIHQGHDCNSPLGHYIKLSFCANWLCLKAVCNIQIEGSGNIMDPKVPRKLKRSFAWLPTVLVIRYSLRIGFLQIGSSISKWEIWSWTSLISCSPDWIA